MNEDRPEVTIIESVDQNKRELKLVKYEFSYGHKFWRVSFSSEIAGESIAFDSYASAKSTYQLCKRILSTIPDVDLSTVSTVLKSSCTE